MNRVGIIVISHGRVGQHMARTVQSIVRDSPPFTLINYAPWDSPERGIKKLEKAIQEANQGQGVLILSDMWGATPTNLCRSLVKKGRVALVTGFNLPMLLKLAQSGHRDQSLEQLAEYIRRYGQKNINIAEAET